MPCRPFRSFLWTRSAHASTTCGGCVCCPLCLVRYPFRVETLWVWVWAPGALSCLMRYGSFLPISLKCRATTRFCWWVFFFCVNIFQLLYASAFFVLSQMSIGWVLLHELASGGALKGESSWLFPTLCWGSAVGRSMNGRGITPATADGHRL